MLAYIFYSVSIVQSQTCLDYCEISSNGSCQKCEEGFYLYKNMSGSSSVGICIGCGINCLTCSPDNDCLSCMDNTLYYEGSCLGCPFTCISCKKGVCTDCITNSNPYGEFCCLPGVASCTWEDIYECEDGYVYTGYSCIPCPPTCTKCIGGYCVSCSEDSTLVDNLYCCEAGTKKCNWEYALECEDGYLLTGGTCVPCPSVCSICVNGKCVNYIISCNVNNCRSCSSDDYCDSCFSGYYLSSGLCKLCPSACLACVSPTVCTSCKTGYTLSNGSCLPSITCNVPNCLTCSSTNYCSSCITGYYVSNGQCLQNINSNHCIKYASGSTWCDLCENGYYSYGGTCWTCFQYCTTCSAQQSCNSCVTGYYLISGYCCPPNCSSCSQTVCWTCSNGYRAVGLNCVPI